MAEYPRYVAIDRGGIMPTHAEVAKLGTTGNGKPIYRVVASGSVSNMTDMAEELNAGHEVLKSDG